MQMDEDMAEAVRDAPGTFPARLDGKPTPICAKALESWRPGVPGSTGGEGVVPVQHTDGAGVVGRDDQTADAGNGDPVHGGGIRSGCSVRVGEKHLTCAETWLIWRLRQGFSQADMALILGVTRSSWQSFEYGRIDPPDWATGWFDVEPLAPHERCRVHRYRAGPLHTQAKIAKDLGISRVWVSRMERGLENCQRLIDYWET